MTEKESLKPKPILAKLAVLFGFLLLMLVGMSYRFYSEQLEKPLIFDPDSIVYEVPRGASFNVTIKELVKLGVFENIWIPKLYAKQHKIESQLKIGELELNSGMTLPEIMSLLVSNKRIKYQVQLIEGWTFQQARETLSRADKMVHTTQEWSDEDILETLGSEYTHPEGLFYPDTYFYHKGDTDLSIMRRAYARLQNVLAQEWEKRSEKLPLSNAYEALILASIIEKETGVPGERAEISGVFVRRLNKNMRLQTDPTVIYGLGDRYKGNIKRSHLKEKTAYNTYVIKGLPPTPIALVGRAAINAALNPKDGKSIFFVAKGDGTHQFSETIAEHNAAVRKYQLKRRKDYKSSPSK